MRGHEPRRGTRQFLARRKELAKSGFTSATSHQGGLSDFELKASSSHTLFGSSEPPARRCKSQSLTDFRSGMGLQFPERGRVGRGPDAGHRRVPLCGEGGGRERGNRLSEAPSRAPTQGGGSKTDERETGRTFPVHTAAVGARRRVPIPEGASHLSNRFIGGGTEDSAWAPAALGPSEPFSARGPGPAGRARC